MKPISNRFYKCLPNAKAEDSGDSIDTILYPRSTSLFQKENLPRLPLIECPPPFERPQRPISRSTSTPSFDSLSESQVPFPSLSSIEDTEDYISTSATHSTVSLSDVVVEESTDVSVAFDIAPPRVDQVLAERSSPETGNRNLSTDNGSNYMLKNVALASPPPSPTTLTDKATTILPSFPHPVKQVHDADASINPSSPRACWSSYAERDLVAHLGESERNRQEVMWEIVASEER
jgi:hypothetical protein